MNQKLMLFFIGFAAVIMVINALPVEKKNVDDTTTTTTTISSMLLDSTDDSGVHELNTQAEQDLLPADDDTMIDDDIDAAEEKQTILNVNFAPVDEEEVNEGPRSQKYQLEKEWFKFYSIPSIKLATPQPIWLWISRKPLYEELFSTPEFIHHTPAP